MPERHFQKVLAANRGEIAIRIFRACYDLGLNTVAMYSKEDTLSLFRTKADEAYLIGEKNSPLGAYLDIGEIIDLARRRGVDAIHPGYGFLSENSTFAKMCRDNGAKSVHAFVSHFPLTPKGVERLMGETQLDELVVTDTIPLRTGFDPSKLPFKLTVLSVAPLIGEAIKRIHSNQSINDLFNHE